MSTIDDLVRRAKRVPKRAREAFFRDVEQRYGKAVADGLRKTIEGGK